MEHQPPFTAVIFGLRQPRGKLARQRRNPLLQPPPEIKRQHIHHRSSKSNGVNAPRIVQLHVPPQVPLLRPEPAQQHHRHNRPLLFHNPQFSIADTIPSGTPAERNPFGTRCDTGEVMDKIMSSNKVTSSPIASSPVQTPGAILEDQTCHPSTPNTSMGVSSSESIDFDSGLEELNNENLKSSERELGNMIILHGYLLSIVDHVGFRRYSSALQPLFKIPTRNIVKSDIMKIFDDEREQTMKQLEAIRSRIVVITDLWASGNQKKDFVAVTGHFIDEEFILQSRILRKQKFVGVGAWGVG
ncbi:hypothetical protein RJ639_012986 [Escallonia herrerae]|uniref:Uncharacterized protein n=1 Tax=Escallonia herrerae TaxID=1293975 RepID=A0AA88VNW5_9ASTE|nr:hypothetical protein RJ639_012986 [Escallonia herrerae]